MHRGTAGSNEIITQGWTVSAGETTKMDSLVPCIEVMQGRITGWLFE